MLHVDEYRDPRLCRALVDSIRKSITRPRTLMEVCGGQTHGLLAHGIDRELAGVVELQHGPGCPVCVTPIQAIDFAMSVSRRPDTVVVSFGDMLRVPGTHGSLRESRESGGNVQLVYSPLDAVRLAERHPDRHWVFFAVGFETTAPATALAVLQASALRLSNFSMIVAHVRVQPAMEAIMQQDGPRHVEGFLAAGHVCTVSGCDSYQDFVRRFRVPVVVTGFEPVDLLQGILACVQQIERGAAEVENRYSRSVHQAGNRHAQRWVDDVYEICDRPWRGLGVVANGGLQLRDAFARFDATRRIPTVEMPPPEGTRCRAGEVLMGRIKPTQCECFGSECTPDRPCGAPMVSAEGACAAYYQHARLTAISSS